MSSIPQEVVELILENFDETYDRNSFVNIALVAINFVAPVQRLLFRSLSVSGRHLRGAVTFQRAVEILSVSPHLVSYVKRLAISLPVDCSPEQHLLTEELLGMFHGIQHFILKGNWTRWDTVTPRLQSSILRFMSLQTLRYVHLIGILDMPPAVLVSLLHTLPTLSFHSVSVDENKNEVASSSPPLVPSKLEHLMLTFRTSDSLCRFLFQPSSPLHAMKLRNLTLYHSVTNSRLIAAYASSLEYLHLIRSVTTMNTALPRLRALEITTTDCRWSDNMLSVWPAHDLAELPPLLPALEEITVNIPPSSVFIAPRRFATRIPS
ncbi:hypothetical protein C8R43DRAFT_1022257 [Mycena crocata]|nr:hypothetical protein C8R43DRAFT_1022257 [Mycena crocata]